MNQLCVITGVAGALGRALAAAFIESGYKVFGIDLVESFNIDNIEYYCADLDRIVYDTAEKETLLKDTASLKYFIFVLPDKSLFFSSASNVSETISMLPIMEQNDCQYP